VCVHAHRIGERRQARTCASVRVTLHERVQVSISGFLCRTHRRGCCGKEGFNDSRSCVDLRPLKHIECALYVCKLGQALRPSAAGPPPPRPAPARRYPPPGVRVKLTEPRAKLRQAAARCETRKDARTSREISAAPRDQRPIVRIKDRGRGGTVLAGRAHTRAAFVSDACRHSSFASCGADKNDVDVRNRSTSDLGDPWRKRGQTTGRGEGEIFGARIPAS